VLADTIAEGLALLLRVQDVVKVLSDFPILGLKFLVGFLELGEDFSFVL